MSKTAESSTQPYEVAVVLPTYNGEKFIKEQIQSILQQTFTDFTLYVFDDASTDGTMDLVRESANSDKRIKIHRNQKNQGIIQNINHALNTIKADIYFLADQDDIWLSHKIERQLEALEPDDVCMTFSDLELMDENRSAMGIRFWENQRIDPWEANRPEYIAIKTMVTGCTMAFKKRLLDISLPISQQAQMHDHWLSFFAAVTGKIAPVLEALVFYRQHTENVIGAGLTPKQRRQRRYEGCETYNEFKDRKFQSYQDLLHTLQAFDRRLTEFNMNQPMIKIQIAFYKYLIQHKWFKALAVSFKIKSPSYENSAFRTVALTIFFPLAYIFLKYFQKFGAETIEM